jgi:hypothetical protein
MPAKGAFDGLEAALRKAGDAFQNQKLLNKLGLGGIRLIKKRTRKGKNVQGQPFDRAPSAEGSSPYSPGHERKREKKGLPTGRIDFVFSLYGGMMEKIDHTVTNDLSDVTITIQDDDKRQIARYWNVEGAGPGEMIRRFWGLSGEETEKVRGLATDTIQQDLDRLLASL